MVFKGEWGGRGGGRSDRTLIEWDRDFDVLVLLNSDLRKQQSRSDIKNNLQEEWK